MTKRDLYDKLDLIRTQHPVHALPLIVQVLADLVARLPEDPAPRSVREHPHKRFVPIDVVIPGKDDHL